jgi:2-keto-3-deoxy-L-rhamnonate aldolase RhmA
LKGQKEGIKIIAMIENAKGMINIESIARAGEGYLDGLLVCPPSCLLSRLIGSLQLKIVCPTHDISG